MGTIRSSIELVDNFSNVLNSIIYSVNQSISTMDELSQTMGGAVNTTSFDAAREAIDGATLAVQELDAAMRNVEPPTISVPTIPATTAPVNNQPVQQPFEWQSYNGLEVFQTTGVERYQQEISSVNAMLEEVYNTQSRIDQQSNESEILSPQAQYDIGAVENRLYALQQSIQQVEENPLNIGTDAANASMEHLRERLSQTLNLQENLNAAMESGDLSGINSAYLRLSQTITDTERMVRDSFENIPPVEIPVHWQSDNLEVFTNTGIERFQQEVQSTNNMLNTLNATQERISATAAGTDLFPANAVTDITNMQNRLLAVQQHIQAIENNPLNMGAANVNAELEQLRSQLNQAVLEQQALNNAVENMDVDAANQAYLRLSQTVGNTERYIRDNVDEQGRFNQAINEGDANANNLMNTIRNAVAAYAGIQTFQKALDLSDTLASTTARLNLMNDGLQTTTQLQSMIFQSAESSRGAYQATADAVSKFGLMAGDAFNSSSEIISFMEQINKQFTIAGTETAGIEAAMLQLTQAMGSGVLRGEEYNSILEQAPNIIQSIADYMEVPKGQLKDMAADGAITAEIVKNAMFAAADETNARFESMPQTFSQIWTSFQNYAVDAFTPVLARMNEIANSQRFQNFVNGAIDALTTVADVALNVFEVVAEVGAFIADNWAVIEPIIYTAAGALIFYTTMLVAHNVVQGITSGLIAATTAAVNIYRAAQARAAGATFASMVSQYGFNAALLACPITWVVAAIGALVGALAIYTNVVNESYGLSLSFAGMLGGSLMTILAALGNLVIMIYNIVVEAVLAVWNIIGEFVNFFANVWTDPLGSVVRLFVGVFDAILSIIETVAGAIGSLFGQDWSSGIQGFRDDMNAAVEQQFGTGAVDVTVDEKMISLDYINYDDAFDAGYYLADNAFGTDNGSDVNVYQMPEVPEVPGIDEIAANTDSINDKLETTEEELKYLRDLAEQETVNRFTTAEINIDQSGMQNIVNNGMDLDGVVDGLTDAVNEAVDIIAEGGYDR